MRRPLADREKRRSMGRGLNCDRFEPISALSRTARRGRKNGTIPASGKVKGERTRCVAPLFLFPHFPLETIRMLACNCQHLEVRYGSVRPRETNRQISLRQR